MVIIQVIQSRWTKVSRGSPGSVARAAVPNAVRVSMPIELRQAVAVIHRVEALEAEGFVLQTVEQTSVDRLPVATGGVRVAACDDGLEVTRLADMLHGWPPRETARVAFRLRQSEWGQALRNNRHGAWRGWTYTKTVVNVAHLGAFEEDVFLRTEPVRVLDEQASLR